MKLQQDQDLQDIYSDKASPEYWIAIQTIGIVLLPCSISRGNLRLLERNNTKSYQLEDNNGKTTNRTQMEGKKELWTE